MNDLEQRFVYTGTAAGIGARIIRIDPPPGLGNDGEPNVDYVTPVQAATCLPVTGGVSESSTGPFTHRVDKPRPLSIVSVGRSYSRAASGSPKQIPYRSEVESGASDVVLIERIRIGNLRGRLVTIHGPLDDFPSITPDVLELDGLVIDGCPVRVTFDASPFTQSPTKQGLRKAYKQLSKAYGRQFCDHIEGQDLPETKKGLTVATVVRDIEFGSTPPNGVDRIGPNRFHWPGIGVIILGELIISDCYRRLTMFRANLGSEIEGSATAGDIQSNGGTIP